MFVFGMILGLPGTVLGLPETVQQFGLTLADRGLLISTLFTGLLFGSLLSGLVVDALGQRVAADAVALVQGGKCARVEEGVGQPREFEAGRLYAMRAGAFD